jgi:hypothetical protein
MHDKAFRSRYWSKRISKVPPKIQDSANSFNPDAHEAWCDGDVVPYQEAGSPDDGI